MAGVHTLTEDQRTRQDRRDRDRDGDPRQVRRARPRPDPEIDDIDEIQGERGDPDLEHHQGQGRQRRQGDVREEERAALQDRETDQHRPVGRGHARMTGGSHDEAPGEQGSCCDGIGRASIPIPALEPAAAACRSSIPGPGKEGSRQRPMRRWDFPTPPHPVVPEPRRGIRDPATPTCQNRAPSVGLGSGLAFGSPE